MFGFNDEGVICVEEGGKETCKNSMGSVGIVRRAWIVTVTTPVRAISVAVVIVGQRLEWLLLADC